MGRQRPLSGSAGVTADPTGRALFVPAGSGIELLFEAEPASELRAERIVLRGSGAELEIEIETDADGRRTLPAAPTGRRIAIPLGLQAGEAARLILRVSADADAGEGAGALVSGAEVWGRPAADLPMAEAPGTAATARPPVILYLIDTLRRDRLGAYGYERPTSPEIDDFASRATLFENSLAQSSWTKSSVASIFTGVWPPVHGARSWKQVLPESFTTLAERLRDAGYRTAAFVTNVNASDQFGLDQGFDDLWYEFKAPAARVNEAAFEWLDRAADDGPFLLYLHTMEPHASYAPEEPYRTHLAPTADRMPSWKPKWKWPEEARPFLSDLYDGEVAQNDAAFGALIERLRALDLFDEALIVLLADHGEEFLEHGGWRHGRVLHAESLAVPLVVKFPNQRTGLRVSSHASHVDVLPTVLEVAGLQAPDGLDGASLLRAAERPVYSHLHLAPAPLQYAVTSGDWKLIDTPGEAHRRQLFDLAVDPGETRDVAADHPVRVSLLADLLARKLAAGEESEERTVEWSEELERSLRALGYLQ